MTASPAHATDDIGTIILDQADRLFRQHVSAALLASAERGEFPCPLWDAIDTAGLPLALVPDAQGGAGLKPAHALGLIRRAAYHTIPLPLGETIIAAALWAEASGAALKGSASLAPTNASEGLSIARVASGYRLAGRAARIPWARQVNNVLVFARDDKGAGFLVLAPRGTGNCEERRNLANEPRDTLVFDATPIAADAVRPAPEGFADGLLPHGALLRSVQMAGAMERSLDHALAYANERRQFGRPIAKFQAIQHMLAGAAGQYAAASAAADLAGEAYGSPAFPLAVAIAKARTGEAAGQVAAICHQVHAAMGFTQEHPLHFATRRLWSWRDEFGNEAFWQERIGRLVASRGGEALWQTVVGI
jgi:acyl-CoA dehydrogenase